MSVTDLVWLLLPLAGVVLALRLRPTVALLLGFALVLTGFFLWGYSVDRYSNNDCQTGEPCPTGEQLIEVVSPVAFLAGSMLVLLGFGRTVWDYWRGVRSWHRSRHSF